MVIAARVSSLTLVFLCNALMWTLFVKSLQKCGSSAEATVTNSASNFVSTVSKLRLYILYQLLLLLLLFINLLM